MIIDSVGYFGSWPYWKAPVEKASDLLALMDEHRIDKLLVCSTRGLFDDWEKGNAEAIELAIRHPGRLHPAVTFGPESLSETVPTERVCRLLEEYHQAGIRCLRLFPQHQGYSLDSSYADPVLAQAVRLHFVILVHARAIMNWGMPVLPLAQVAALVSRYPEARLVIGGVNSEWPAAASIMKTHPGVLLETSCLQYLQRVAFFTREFGSGRLLYGSGLALQYPACGLIKVKKAQITEEEREDILSRNAQRLFFDG